MGTLGQFRKGFGWGCTGPTPKGEVVADDFPNLGLMQLLIVPQQQTWSIYLELEKCYHLRTSKSYKGQETQVRVFPTTMVSTQVCLITFFFLDSLIT